MPRNRGRRTFVAGSLRLAIVSPLISIERWQTVAEAAPRLGAAERRALRAAADVIIPAEGRMPSASAAGVIPYIEKLAAVDQRVGALLGDGLRELNARAGGVAAKGFAALPAAEKVEVLAVVEKADVPAGFFVTLRDAVYEGYYTQPRIWTLLGAEFRSAPRRTAVPEPFDEARLARVRGMGALYRPVS